MRAPEHTYLCQGLQRDSGNVLEKRPASDSLSRKITSSPTRVAAAGVG